MQKDKFLKFLERIKKINESNLNLYFSDKDIEKLLKIDERILNHLMEIKNKNALAYATLYVLKMSGKDLTLNILNEIMEGIDIIKECPKYGYYLCNHLTDDRFIKEKTSLEGAHYITRCPSSEYINYIENIYAISKLKDKSFYAEIILKCKNIEEVREVYLSFLDFPLSEALEYSEIIMSSQSRKAPFYLKCLFDYLNAENKEEVMKATKILASIKEDYKVDILYDYLVALIKDNEKIDDNKVELILRSKNSEIAKTIYYALTKPQFENKGIDVLASEILLDAPKSLDIDMATRVLFYQMLIFRGDNLSALQILTESENKEKAKVVSDILLNNNAIENDINLEMAAIANSCYGIDADIVKLISSSPLLARLKISVPMGRILAGEYDEEDILLVREVISKDNNLKEIVEMFKEALKRIKALKRGDRDTDMYIYYLTKGINRLLSICVGRKIEVQEKNASKEVKPITGIDLLMSYTESKNGQDIEVSELEEVLKKVK